MRDDLPAEAAGLSEAQALFLADLAAVRRPRARSAATPGRTSSTAAGSDAGVSSRDTFAAVYAAFLGRDNGPRAGWLLASLEPGFVAQRLRAAAAAAEAAGVGGTGPGTGSAAGTAEGGAA